MQLTQDVYSHSRRSTYPVREVSPPLNLPYVNQKNKEKRGKELPRYR